MPKISRVGFADWDFVHMLYMQFALCVEPTLYLKKKKKKVVKNFDVANFCQTSFHIIPDPRP